MELYSNELMMDLKKKIVLCGPACSGKDYIKDMLIKLGYRASIAYTTRAIREGESNGVEYHFVTETEFEKKVSNGRMFEHKVFNGWRYGTTQFYWEDSDVFIFTPSGIRNLSKEDRERCFVVYLQVSEDVLMKRLLERNDTVDAMERRIESDEKDFKDFDDFDLAIINEATCAFNPALEIINHLK